METNIMDLEYELLEEIYSKRKNKRSLYLENLLECLFEYSIGDDKSFIEKKYHCSIFLNVEKHNSLQFTYWFEISFNLIDCFLSLEIEQGIDNGTVLRDYSFLEPLEPQTRTVKVIKDIILDKSMYSNDSFLMKKAQAILDRDKHLIYEYIRKNDYDNYVTGGYSKLKAQGLWTELYLDYVYEEIEVDLNII